MAVLLTTGTARAQLNPDFPPADGPGRAPAPEKPSGTNPESPGDTPVDVPRLVLGAGVHAGVGIAPEVALGVHAAVELATMRWSVGLEGRHDLPASGHTGAGARARSSLLGLAFVPCARTQSLWACGVVLASGVTATGEGPTGAAEQSGHFVLGVGARLAAHLRLPHDFAVRFTVEGLVHPIPWSITRDEDVIYKASVVSGTVGLGVVHAF
ncbi:MAG: hypothetical protein JWP97_2425 [Labilithrix sp.]|nr:hypothetical protein [Labilithrix sp.]